MKLINYRATLDYPTTLSVAEQRELLEAFCQKRFGKTFHGIKISIRPVKPKKRKPQRVTNPADNSARSAKL